MGEITFDDSQDRRPAPEMIKDWPGPKMLIIGDMPMIRGTDQPITSDTAAPDTASSAQEKPIAMTTESISDEPETALRIRSLSSRGRTFFSGIISQAFGSLKENVNATKERVSPRAAAAAAGVGAIAATGTLLLLWKRRGQSQH